MLWMMVKKKGDNGTQNCYRKESAGPVKGTHAF